MNGAAPNFAYMPEYPEPSFFETLKGHQALALKVLAGVLLAAAAAGYLTRQYTASSVVALNPAAAAAQVSGGSSGGEGQRAQRTAVEIAWIALADQKIAAIIQQFQLDTELAQLRSQGQVFTYIRSNIFLHEAESPGNAPPEVVVTFTGEDRVKTIEVANAIAQSLSGAAAPSSPGTAASSSPDNAASRAAIAQALAKSRENLRLLAQSQNSPITRDDVEQHLRKDAELQAELRDTNDQLAALQTARESELRAIAPQLRPAPVQAPKPDPARVELEREIQQAQSRLDALREKYTDAYPDVQDAAGALAALQAKLAHMPAAKTQPPLPPPRQSANTLAPDAMTALAKRQDELTSRQSELEQEIKQNQDEAEGLRQRLADKQTFAHDYQLEQQRYNALLQAQKAAASAPEGPGSSSAPPARAASAAAGGASSDVPLFIIVDSATSADATGIQANPLFWVSSAAFGLLCAGVAVFLAEEFNPMEREEPRGSFHAG